LKQIAVTSCNERLRIIDGQEEPRMKRVLFGLIWFFAFSIGGIAAMGAVAGYKSANTNQASNFADGVRVGEAAGRDVGAKYGAAVILGALFLAAVGTAARVLPGTKGRVREPTW
jgi:hypothetical protein